MSHGRATPAEEGASRWRAAAGAPSFVLLMPDDFPRNFLGAAHGLTPTLDRLRATGVNFARAYTTAPLCSPSRYCVITGRHATSGLTKHAAAGEASGGKQVNAHVPLQLDHAVVAFVVEAREHVDPVNAGE